MSSGFFIFFGSLFIGFGVFRFVTEGDYLRAGFAFLGAVSFVLATKARGRETAENLTAYAKGGSIRRMGPRP